MTRNAGKWIVALSVVVGLMLGGCSRPADNGGPVSGNADAGKLAIKGSDTMVHLVANWAEVYMKAHPESEISVTGGGSGTGIMAMLNGTTDLCMASRKVKSKEKEDGQKKGIMFNETVVARDGIAVVVNKANPVNELTMDQLRQIFNGTLETWDQVGGTKDKLQVLSRESNSGTYVFFAEHVLKKDDYGPKVRRMTSNATIAGSVEQDKYNIGYVGLGYAKKADVKIIKVKADEATPGVSPSLKTVADGTYPVARPLHIYSNGEAIGLAKAFIDFTLSDEGQKIVEETGYIPVR